jgi:hypothetical protein
MRFEHTYCINLQLKHFNIGKLRANLGNVCPSRQSDFQVSMMQIGFEMKGVENNREVELCRLSRFNIYICPYTIYIYQEVKHLLLNCNKEVKPYKLHNHILKRKEKSWCK